MVFALYFNFGITIVETKIKIWTYFKSQEQELISKHENLVFEKNLRVITNFSRKHCLPVITSNKNNLLKQAVPITYTLEKRFFAVAILLKVCESSLSDRVKELVVYFGLHESSMDFQRTEGQLNAVYEK